MDSLNQTSGESQSKPVKGKKRRIYQKVRAEKHREVVGTAFMENRSTKIRDQLLSGAKTPSAAIQHMGGQVVHQAAPLPVTTRGIGFATCHLLRALSDYPSFNAPDVYSVYRAALGILEAKLAHIQTTHKAPNVYHRDCHSFGLDADWMLASKSATVLPEPLFRIIGAVGPLTSAGCVRLPVVARNQTDEDGGLYPTPENVLLSTLRATVLRLADPHTPRAVRENFKANNPIPGCVFNGRLLMNPDEIIPANYGPLDFKRDIERLTRVLPFIEKHLPKMVGGPVNYDGPGTTALLLSNDMQGMRCPDLQENQSLDDYVRNSHPVGNITEFWTTVTALDPPNACLGVISLLGELPRGLTACYPLYIRRLSEANEIRHILDYSSVTVNIYGTG